MTLKMALCAALGTALLGIAGPSLATAPSQQASIPFVNFGGIRDWQADEDRGLWIQDAHRNWYYAKLMGPCFGLNFATTIGFDARPMDTFDRFSAIIVPREGRCMVQSLTPSAGPSERG
jgi:uncharacterized protein DUF6491